MKKFFSLKKGRKIVVLVREFVKESKLEKVEKKVRKSSNITKVKTGIRSEIVKFSSTCKTD